MRIRVQKLGTHFLHIFWLRNQNITLNLSKIDIDLKHKTVISYAYTVLAMYNGGALWTQLSIRFLLKMVIVLRNIILY